MKSSRVILLLASALVVASNSALFAQIMPGVVRLQLTHEAAADMPALFQLVRPARDPEFHRSNIYAARVSDASALQSALGIPRWVGHARLEPLLPTHSFAFPDIRERSNPELFKRAYSVVSPSNDLRVAEEKIARWFTLRFDSTLSVDRVIALLRRLPSVAVVEPVVERHTCYIPNDSLVSEQYALPLIHAFEAWDIVRCDSSMLVADVDLGCDWSHPDLIGAIFVNQGEIGIDSDGMDKRANGVDDDGNGLIDDWHGWDFDGADGASPDNDTRTNESHGTHTTGILAASGNNRIGIAGVAFGAKVLVVKASNESGQSLDFGFDGIAYAADMHAKVVSCSWGGPTRSQAEQDIIDYATSKNCAVVAASGNHGIDENFYPASYRNVLSVGAVQDGAIVAGYTNFNTGVDVIAPGTDVMSTMPGGWYYFLTGTSMACPNAAGALALVRQKFPSLSVLQAMERLRATSSTFDTNVAATFPVDPGRYDLLGHGLVNIYRAVTDQNPHSARIDSWSLKDANGRLEAGETAGVQLNVRNYLAPLSDLQAHIEVVQGADVVSILTSSLDLGAVASDAIVSNDPAAFQIKAADSIGRNTEIIIKIAFSDSTVGYDRDVDYIELVLNPDYLDLNANNLTVTFSSKGTIGYNDVISNSQGAGFQWRVPPPSITAKGRNVLYQAGLMLATDQLHIVDAVQGNSDIYPDNDFVPTVRVHYVEPDKPKALQQLSSEFDDSGADSMSRVGVIVRHDAYAFDGPRASNAVVVRYAIHEAPGFTDTTLLNAGLFADWDIGLSGSINTTYFDTATGIAVTRRLESGYPWVGVKIVSPLPVGASLNFHAIRNDGTEGDINTYDGFSPYEKWLSLTEGAASAGPADVSQVLGVTGFVLSPETPDTLTAIMALGESEEDLRATVAETEAKWNSRARVLSGVSASKAAVWPNPFTSTIAIELPEGCDKAHCTISDMLGRIVYRGDIDRTHNSVEPHGPAGTYAVEITSGSLRYVATIVRD